MNRICYIVSAGDNAGTNFKKRENDYVIAADGGYDVLKKMNIKPDLTVGDFDSLGYVPKEQNMRVYKAEKDDTDTMIAIKEALNMNYKNIVLFGGTGGRIDHTIANIQSMVYAAKCGTDITMIDKDKVYKIIVDTEIVLPARKEGYMSLFSLNNEANGVFIRGAKYELDNANLSNDFPLGVSNAFIGNDIYIKVVSGILLVIFDNV